MSDTIMIPENEYRERVQKAAPLIAAAGIDVLVANSN